MNRIKETDPSYKMIMHGKMTLSSIELLNMIMRTRKEVAEKLMEKAKFNLHNLSKMNIDTLQEVGGIGPKTATALVAALELGRRRRCDETYKMEEIHSSNMVYEYILPYLEDREQEHFYAIFMNKKNRILKTEMISKGGISETVVDTKVIFAHALKCYASSLILAHNHPSGHAHPSQADRHVTERVKQAASLLDIKLLDHLIIGDQCYYSFGDQGLI